ncbi:MAG: hypothetical protein B7Y39_09535 [Bdellovibrio sp. 28-41-41]|nr:MAG: hypothetical protein B7Y39_09535 [Bdellovibrio sp. 28-41-41]
MLRGHHNLMWSFTRSFVKSFKRPVFIYLASLAVTVQIFFAALFYIIEKNFNPAVATFFDALYYTVTVTTGVGLGDISPITTPGKALSMVMMLSGTVIFVCFTAVLAASILAIEAEHLKEKQVDDPNGDS